MDNNSDLFALNDITTLTIFDDNGQFITNIDYNQKSNVCYVENKGFEDEEMKAFIKSESEILDFKLLRFLNDSNKETKSLSDYELALNTNKEKIVFNKKKKVKECKLIGKTYIRNINGEDKTITFNVPKALISKNIEFTGGSNECSKNNLLIEILSYNEDGDLFELILGRWSDAT